MTKTTTNNMSLLAKDPDVEFIMVRTIGPVSQQVGPFTVLPGINPTRIDARRIRSLDLEKYERIFNMLRVVRVVRKGDPDAGAIWEVRTDADTDEYVTCGYRFTPEPTRVETAKLTPYQRQYIMNNPVLIVKVVEPGEKATKKEGRRG